MNTDLMKFQSVLSGMSLEQKVGMLLMAPLVHEPEQLKELLDRFYCGSLIVRGGEGYEHHCSSPAEFRAMTDHVQELSLHYRKIPVWLHNGPGGEYDKQWFGEDFSWLRQAARQQTDLKEVERWGHSFGEYRRALGTHNILGPTVNVPLYDSIILPGTILSSDTDIVAAYASALVRGASAARCGTMTQHFPAHGATKQDSHDSYPVVDLPEDILWRDHMTPYLRCFEAGCTSICTAHLACTALDPDPSHMATTSRPILIDTLRGRMGFEGIIIADAVEMKGFQKNGPIEKVVVDAVNAGCDSICLWEIKTVELVFNSLLNAAGKGSISMERIDDALTHQIQFMDWLGIL